MIVGRPVRFVVLVVGGWSMTRVILALSATVVVGADEPPSPKARPAGFGPVQHARTYLDRTGTKPVQISAVNPASAWKTVESGYCKGRVFAPGQSHLCATDSKLAPVVLGSTATSLPGVQAALAEAPTNAISAPESGIPGLPRAEEGRSSRWSGAAWMLWRLEGGDTSLAPAGRLGGSQAGLRLDYALDPGSALQPALYGRLSGALVRPVAAEAAVGIALRPAALPLVFGLEHRTALSRGGRDDFAFIVAGGIYRRPLTRHLRIDGYGQAGFVGFARPDAFADGRLTIETALAPTLGSGDLAIGAALWGGAQPGLARLDIGPQATARLPVGGTHVRLGTEWRQRIAGDVRPASGPAITVGVDF